MKRVYHLFLAILFALVCFSGCNKTEAKEIPCEEIVNAYRSAGYTNIIHRHNEEDYQLYDGEECSIIIHENENAGSDAIYIKTFSTQEEAKNYADSEKYHVVKWIFALPFGEYRWLKTGQYGRLEYSSYNPELLKPLKGLMQQN